MQQHLTDTTDLLDCTNLYDTHSYYINKCEFMFCHLKRNLQNDVQYTQLALVTYVTGYSKTDHNVTFGQLLFIGSANSHTHTLPMRCCITGLS